MMIPNSNLKRICPDFLLSSGTIKSILQVEDKEHDRLRDLIKDIKQQCFIETATWGLDEWENMANIQPDPDATIEQRRATILARLQFSSVSTKRFLEELIKKYCYENTQVEIREINPENKFIVFLTDGDAWNIADLIKAIEDYKPAHLAYGWGVGVTTDLYQIHELDGLILIETKHNHWNKGECKPLYWDGEADFSGAAKWDGILPGEGYTDQQRHDLRQYRVNILEQYFANDKHIIYTTNRVNRRLKLDGKHDLTGSDKSLSDTIKHNIEILEI